MKNLQIYRRTSCFTHSHFWARIGADGIKVLLLRQNSDWCGILRPPQLTRRVAPQSICGAAVELRRRSRRAAVENSTQLCSSTAALFCCVAAVAAEAAIWALLYGPESEWLRFFGSRISFRFSSTPLQPKNTCNKLMLKYLLPFKDYLVFPDFK